MEPKRELDLAYLSWARQLARAEAAAKKGPGRAVVHQMVERAKRRAWWVKVLRNARLLTPPVQLLSQMRPVLALHPTNRSLLEAGEDLLQCLNARAIDDIRHRIGEDKTKPLVVIIGCRKREKILLSRLKQIQENATDIQVLGIIGNERIPDWKFKFRCYRERGILEVPCKDTYEALPEKVMWTCLAMHLTLKGRGIFKIDDDTEAVNAKKIESLLEILDKENKDAAGSPISVGSPLEIDRGWHLGKCSGTKNKKPFEGIGPKQWMSGGAGYLLSAKGVETLAEFCLHSWNFIRSQIYEDLTVSWILQSTSKKIHWIKDWSQLGVRNERTVELSMGRRYHKIEDLEGGRDT